MTRAPDFPELRRFFEGYMHEDFMHEYGTAEGALRAYEADRLALANALPIAGLHSIGRNGEFAHILMEDIYWRTLARIPRIEGALGARPIIQGTLSAASA